MEVDLWEIARKIRIQSLQMVAKSRSSHIGAVYSIADIIALLYFEVMKVNPNSDSDPSRDRFILSKGHAAAGVYSALAQLGFISEDELGSYAQPASRLMAHVSHKVPGVEFSTGSLGHGVPHAVGRCWYAKLKGEAFRTFVLVGDGELAEGSNWEAFLFAAHHRLDNLVVIVDGNNLQSLDTVERTLNLNPLEEKMRSFGWEFIHADGHDFDSMRAALRTFTSGRPLMVYAETTKGKGVTFMENSVAWHYKSPSESELSDALAQLRKD